MASNKIQDLTPAALVELANQMIAAIGNVSPNPYGLPSAQVNALRFGATTLTESNTAVNVAKAAYHAAIQGRLASDADCTDAAAAVARLVYANPDVTPEMIAAMGLSPRSASRAKIVPQAPTALNAAMLPTGEIALSWTSGNPYGVTYRVESKAGAGSWSFATETTAAKVTLDGIAAGVPTAFRVSASRNGTVSAFSPVATVYSDAAAPALRLAA